MRGPRARRETGRTTQAGTRYGCFLPDLTGLARDLSAASLPAHYIRSAPARRKENGASGAATAIPDKEACSSRNGRCGALANSVRRMVFWRPRHYVV